MRHLALLTVIGLLLCCSTTARAVQPFIGTALQYDVAFPHYDLSSLTQSGWLHDFGCWGSETTVGLAWPAYTVYAGYHFSSSSVYGEWGPERRSSWREKRVLLGIRRHLNWQSDYVVLPTIGAALSYGESTLMWNVLTDDAESSTLRKSKNMGVMVEFGFLIRASSAMDVSIMAQGHRFEPHFGDDGNEAMPDHYVVLMPGWQIGMRVRFPDLK